MYFVTSTNLVVSTLLVLNIYSVYLFLKLRYSVHLARQEMQKPPTIIDLALEGMHDRRQHYLNVNYKKRMNKLLFWFAILVAVDALIILIRQ